MYVYGMVRLVLHLPQPLLVGPVVRRFTSTMAGDIWNDSQKDTTQTQKRSH